MAQDTQLDNPRLWAEGKFAEIYQKYFGYAPEYPLWSHKGLQPGIVKEPSLITAA